MHSFRHLPQKAGRRQQRGISLFVILILVMLAMLTALWASRSALFNQMVVSNDADYQRAFSAAQAMLQDAELDILRKRPDGTICQRNTSKPKICREPRPALSPKMVYPPIATEDVDSLIATLSNITDTQCRYGLCSKRGGAQDFWNDSALLAKLQKTNVGARYGEFTGAVHASGTDQLGATGNPILNQTGDGSQGAWYWIEVMPYTDAAAAGQLVVGGNIDLLPINVNPLVVYRITAIAYGQKPSTRVVLQQTFVPQRLRD